MHWLLFGTLSSLTHTTLSLSLAGGRARWGGGHRELCGVFTHFEAGATHTAPSLTKPYPTELCAMGGSSDVMVVLRTRELACTANKESILLGGWLQAAEGNLDTC